MDGSQKLGLTLITEAVEQAKGTRVVAVPADVGVEYDLRGGHGRVSFREWGMSLL